MPPPALALREIQTVESGLEQQALARALGRSGEPETTAGLEGGTLHVNLWGARKIKMRLDHLSALSSLSDQARHQLANEIIRQRSWWSPYENRDDFVRRLTGKVSRVNKEHLSAVADSIGPGGFRFTRRALGIGVGSIAFGGLAAYFGIRQVFRGPQQPAQAVSSVSKVRIDPEVQEVVNRALADPRQGGVIIRLQTHVRGDAQDILNFAQAIAQQIGPQRVLVMGEAGAPSYGRMGQLLGELLIPDKKMRDRIRRYYVQGGAAPLPLEVIFPDPAQRLRWQQRFAQASPDWQESWKTLRLQRDDENAGFSATLSRGLAQAKIDHLWEATELQAWILKAIMTFSLRAAERELYEKGSEETYFSELQDHIDFVGWMIGQRDYDLARQLEKLMQRYPDRIIIVVRGASHDELDDAIQYGSTPHALSRGYGVLLGELVPVLELERRRRHEGRIGQPFNEKERAEVRKYVISTLLESLLEEGNRESGGKNWSQAMRNVMDPISDDVARALNRAVFEQMSRPDWIRSLPYPEMRKAQTYFIYAWLNERRRIPDSFKQLVPPAIQELNVEKWEQVVRGYLSKAGLEGIEEIAKRILEQPFWTDSEEAARVAADMAGRIQQVEAVERAAGVQGFSSPRVRLAKFDFGFTKESWDALSQKRLIAVQPGLLPPQTIENLREQFKDGEFVELPDALALDEIEGIVQQILKRKERGRGASKDLFVVDAAIFEWIQNRLAEEDPNWEIPVAIVGVPVKLLNSADPGTVFDYLRDILDKADSIQERRMERLEDAFTPAGTDWYLFLSTRA